MKRLTINLNTQILFALFLWTTSAIFGQIPSIEWQKCIGGSLAEGGGASSIQQTSDGGYIIGGSSKSNDGDVTLNYGKTDYFLVKLNSLGILTWQKSYGGTSYDGINCVIQTKDGGYILAGYSDSNDGDVIGNNGNGAYWIVKINSVGVIEWKKCYGGTSSEGDGASSIQQTTDGGYIIAGSSESNNGDVSGNHGNADYWILKINSMGVIQWQKSYGGSKFDYAKNIIQTTDGGFIIAGNSNSNDGDVIGNHGGDADSWLVKINSIGVIEWQKCYGGKFGEEYSNIQQTLDGGFIMVVNSNSTDGDITGNHSGSSDIWVVKLSAIGSIQWQKTYGGSASEYAENIIQTTDGGYIVAGNSNSKDGDVTGNHGDLDSWLVKINSTGSIIWQKSIGGTHIEHTPNIYQTTDGGFITAGYTESNDGDVSGNHGTGDIWIVKLSAETGLHEELFSSVVSVYPNPFAGFIHISNIALKSKIQIQDVNGKIFFTKICTTEDVDIELNNYISKGVYYLHILNENDKITDIKKLVFQ